MARTKTIAFSVLPQIQEANKTLTKGLPLLLMQYPMNILVQQSKLLRSIAEATRIGHSIAVGVKVQR